MDFRDTPEQADYRAKTRAWLQEHCPVPFPALACLTAAPWMRSPTLSRSSSGIGNGAHFSTTRHIPCESLAGGVGRRRHQPDL